ncbi:hypothetical protein PBI_INGRID_70 [Arthrobacter phage Ingrid]|nr:hypothetical protein PBI_INGRID_70 [Arthrobacter phage Ingrid]QFG11049.1 hypothetical protein PBI_LORETTA_67 [Arthrobacter phage Loretta]
MTEVVIPVNPQIPFQLESKGYIMNPSDTDLIRGKELEDGMIVLLEDSLLREEPTCTEDPEHKCGSRCHRAFKTSRWCKVSKLEKRMRVTGEVALLSFVGEYADGSKSSHTYNVSYFWYVKLDSIPKKDD